MMDVGIGGGAGGGAGAHVSPVGGCRVGSDQSKPDLTEL